MKSNQAADAVRTSEDTYYALRNSVYEVAYVSTRRWLRASDTVAEAMYGAVAAIQLAQLAYDDPQYPAPVDFLLTGHIEDVPYGNE